MKTARDTFRESPGNDERKTDLNVKSCSKDQECFVTELNWMFLGFIDI